MKYRLVELLRCIRCHANLDVSDATTRPVANVSGEIFPCRERCSLDRTTTIPASGRCAECVRTEIVAGTLACRQCGQEFRIVESVPWLFEDATLGTSGQGPATVEVYSHLWTQLTPTTDPGPNHLEPMEEALAGTIVCGALGLDAGSGCGADTVAMARRHPDVEIVSLDLSEGVYQTSLRSAGLPNVHVVRASVLAIPVASEMFDFAYSFGVLHHTSDPERGMEEIARVLKPDGRVSLYLYEDHEDNPWKRIPLKLVSALRRLTTRLPTTMLSGLCYLLSPLAVLFFSVPARILQRFEKTKILADKMPFNFGTSLFSVHADLLDRFGAPIEVRYSRQGVIDLLRQGGLADVQTTKLDTTAGWVARGVKQ